MMMRRRCDERRQPRRPAQGGSTHAGCAAMTSQNRIPADVLAVQRAASDPAVSAWVSANAGSGKTHVLAQRVIRLLLSGTAPEKILCLTYTKAAAANMANRVFETLARWTAFDDAKLDAE